MNQRQYGHQKPRGRPAVAQKEPFPEQRERNVSESEAIWPLQKPRDRPLTSSRTDGTNS